MPKSLTLYKTNWELQHEFPPIRMLKMLWKYMFVEFSILPKSFENWVMWKTLTFKVAIKEGFCLAYLKEKEIVQFCWKELILQ